MPDLSTSELSMPATGFIGRLSLSDPPSRVLKFGELKRFVFEGGTDLAEYALHFRPTVRIEATIPKLKEGSFEEQRVSLKVPFGGRLICDDGRRHLVECSEDEMLASLGDPGIVYSAVAGEEHCLLDVALLRNAIRELMDEGWPPAEGLDLDSPEHRAKLRDSLAPAGRSDGAVARPIELLVVPGAPMAPFDPATVKGAATTLGRKEMEHLYHEARDALLRLEPPDGRGYVEHLADLDRKCRAALDETLASVHRAGEELVRNWIALCMIHAATPESPDKVRVLNVSGDWLLDGENFTRLHGAGGRSERTSQHEAFRILVVSADEADQSNAVSKVVVLDRVATPVALEPLGRWAEEQNVVVYLNVASDDIEHLDQTLRPMMKGVPDSWGQHLTLTADEFLLRRGADSTISLPTAAAVAAGQSRLDGKRRGSDDPVGEMAAPFAGNHHALFAPEGAGRFVSASVSGRKIEDLTDFKLIDTITGGFVNMPVPLDGGDGYRMKGASTLFEPPDDSPNRVFKNVAAVRIRNWIVRTIKRHLARHYLDRGLDTKGLNELEADLREWLATLDIDRRTGRGLIAVRDSSVTVNLEQDTVHVIVTIAYPVFIRGLRVTTRTAEPWIIECEKQGDVYVPRLNA